MNLRRRQANHVGNTKNRSKTKQKPSPEAHQRLIGNTLETCRRPTDLTGDTNNHGYKPKRRPQGSNYWTCRPPPQHTLAMTTEHAWQPDTLPTTVEHVGHHHRTPKTNFFFFSVSKNNSRTSLRHRPCGHYAYMGGAATKRRLTKNMMRNSTKRKRAEDKTTKWTNKGPRI